MEFIETTREGFAVFGAYRTWYRVTGNLDSGLTPLVILHGGPGGTHEYLDAFKDVAASGHAVIHYDQLDNGRSTLLPDKAPSFWSLNLFLEELDNLLDHLQISNNYALLGQSRGSVLGCEHALLHPRGLRTLIVANSPSCMRTWISENQHLRTLLPQGVQQTLLMQEQSIRLKEWNITGRLSKIEVPTLVISGRHDPATAQVVKPFLEEIPDVRWALFEDSTHMPHIEERQACMGTVVKFLDETCKTN
ncbi:alpha/beta fold hydrolase [Pseudomonas sp. CCM 7891]|uniref:Alpha/beta fold hydrolase n=1 Tax=Pseudomonas karstica TaxID=1055468 RepID=A0A7X2RT55_9PSED|nr:alpha/beta fold hydrolase [Pseudomonas karstica]MTD19555.1 alpha/beta fold hydrolase [Pseudomonas karstica]